MKRESLITGSWAALIVRLLSSNRHAAEGNAVKVSMGEIQNARPAAKGHGVSIRKDGGEDFLYLALADSGMAFTTMTSSGEVVWKKDRQTINQESDGILADPKTGFRSTNISFRPDGGY